MQENEFKKSLQKQRHKLSYDIGYVKSNRFGHVILDKKNVEIRKLHARIEEVEGVDN